MGSRPPPEPVLLLRKEVASLPSWSAHQESSVFGREAVTREDSPAIESSLCAFQIFTTNTLWDDSVNGNQRQVLANPSARTSKIDSLTQFLLSVPLLNSLADCFTSQTCVQNPPRALQRHLLHPPHVRAAHQLFPFPRRRRHW